MNDGNRSFDSFRQLRYLAESGGGVNHKNNLWVKLNFCFEKEQEKYVFLKPLNLIIYFEPQLDQKGTKIWYGKYELDISLLSVEWH